MGESELLHAKLPCKSFDHNGVQHVYMQVSSADSHITMLRKLSAVYFSYERIQW